MSSDLPEKPPMSLHEVRSALTASRVPNRAKSTVEAFVAGRWEPVPGYAMVDAGTLTAWLDQQRGLSEMEDPDV